MSEPSEAIGATIFITALSVVISVFISLIILNRYRRSVLCSMNSNSPNGDDLLIKECKLSKPLFGLTIDTEIVDSLEKNNSVFIKQYKKTLLYLLAGCVFSLVFTVGFFISGNIDFLPFRALVIFLSYLWPVIIVMSMVVSVGNSKSIFLAYFMLLITIFIISSIVAGISFLELTMYWFLINIMPTFIVLGFFIRKFRSIGSIVFLFSLFSVLGFYVFAKLIESSYQLQLFLVEVAVTTKIGGTLTYLAFSGLGLALFSIIGWFFLISIKKKYLRKEINDISIQSDSIFLTFSLMYSLSIASQSIEWILLGFISFMLYRASLIFGIENILLSKNNKEANKKLLLLRVFSLEKRSEDLYSLISKLWRYQGSIQLISGPDLVNATVEPHEILDFISGKLSNLFVSNSKDLEHRMNTLDLEPDKDGYYRINEFFCYDNTWKLALKKLVTTTDYVVMDLRSFSPNNAGCIIELSALINLISLEKVMLIVDKTTNMEFLEKTLNQAWESISNNSPNLRKETNLRIFKLNNRNLVNSLFLQINS